ncbi:hypothetical protein [Methanocalculus natronophilus]|uniref:hypothetical protein n=1 Tax=Methanocalculus natronophilus TaxID=1262400 RepID=UPI0031B5C5A7
MTTLNEAKRRLELAELHTKHRNERISPEQLSEEVDQVIRAVGEEILPSGIRFMDATPQEQKRYSERWLLEHPEGPDDRINIEREYRKVAHLLPEIRRL